MKPTKIYLVGLLLVYEIFVLTLLN